MKKRITALLLCLVMVLSLIPTTAWADTCTAKIKFKVIPVYVDSSKNLGYDVDYASAWEGTLPCTYTSKHSSNANHSIEIKGFHPSKMGWTVRDGYKWIGWDKTTTSTPQFSTYYDWSSSPASFNGTGTHYVYMVYGPTTPTIPEPVASNIGEIVTVEDTTGIHKDRSYLIADADLAAATKPSATKRIVTIHSNNYVPSFNEFYDTKHTLRDGSNAEQTVELTYDTNANKWSASPTTVTFTVECKAEEQPPAAPTREEIQKALEDKTFLITDTTKLHLDSLPVIKESDLKDANFFYEPSVKELQNKNITSNPYKNGDGDWVYVLRVDGDAKLQSYIDDYNKDPEKGKGVEHKYIYHDYTFLKKGDDGNWSMSSSYIATINVKCETAPAAPSEAALLKIPGAVRVSCQDADEHNSTTALKEGTFTANSKVTKDETTGVYTYTVTLKEGAAGSADYIAERNKNYPYYHTEAANGRRNTVKFTWDSDSRVWKIAVVDTDAAIIPVECHMPTDEELTDLLKGRVTVDCSLIENHGPHTYDADVTTLKPLTIQKDDETGTIFCTVGLNSTGTYVEKYNAEKEFSNSAPHEVVADAPGTDLTVKLVWNANKWTVDEGDTFKIITKCKPVPKVPTADELKNLENAVLVQCRGMNTHDPDAQSYKLIDGTYVTERKDPETGEIETAGVYWDDGAWRYNLFVKSLAYHGVDGFIPYIEQFNETTGRYHDEYDIYSGFVQLTLKDNGWKVDKSATVFVTCPPAAPTVDELNKLDLTVSVSCKNKPTAHRTHSFDLADGYFSTEVFLGEGGEYFCRVTLTKADAKHYVSQFDKITSKSHKVSKVEGEILLKWVDNTPSPTALTVNDGNEEEYTYWALADEDGNTTLNVTATCRKNGGGSSTDTKDDGGKKIESGKTFDAGIAMYVGLGILSVTGSAMVIRKKKEF